MAEFYIRPWEPGDVPALSALWARVFGDDEALIRGFFRLLPELGVGAAAVRDGAPVGAAYALTGLELAGAGKEAVPCAYLYAVAVDEAARHLGAGRALCRAAGELAAARGAAFLCTLPAEASLYDWYGEILGLVPALYRRTSLVKAGGPGPFRRLSAGDYLLRREELLSGRPHLRLSLPAMELERLLCETYGGGLFAWDGGLAAVYREGGRGLVRELLGADGETGRRAAADALGAALGVEELLFFAPCSPGEGTPYIAAPPGALPPDCVWNISFD